MIKQYIREFLRRGLIACGFGPLVLVILYLILQQQCNLQTLTVQEVCLGILSLSALAFLAGGMNMIYQIEQLPLMVAILIHGGVLYVSYLATYLINGWLEWGAAPILVFTGIFVLGYLAIWVAIYSINRKTTEKLNKLLQQQHISENL
jgi:hypothetical protein